jgi:hypothetical protein
LSDNLILHSFEEIMKATRPPTIVEINELIAFLPKLYADGLKPVDQWHGGKPDAAGIIQMPYPEYNQVVEEFFRTAGQDFWCDFGYDPTQAGQMIRDAGFVKNSSLDQIKTMLTFCVRGERFCDGHWGEMVESGNIRNILERLAELVSLM